jgi:hypothetical protein
MVTIYRDFFNVLLMISLYEDRKEGEPTTKSRELCSYSRLLGVRHSHYSCPLVEK